MAEPPEAMSLSEPPPVTREEVLGWLAGIVHNHGISLEHRIDALRVHALLWD